MTTNDVLLESVLYRPTLDYTKFSTVEELRYYAQSMGFKRLSTSRQHQDLLEGALIMRQYIEVTSELQEQLGDDSLQKIIYDLFSLDEPVEPESFLTLLNSSQPILRHGDLYFCLLHRSFVASTVEEVRSKVHTAFSARPISSFEIAFTEEIKSACNRLSMTKQSVSRLLNCVYHSPFFTVKEHKDMLWLKICEELELEYDNAPQLVAKELSKHSYQWKSDLTTELQRFS